LTNNKSYDIIITESKKEVNKMLRMTIGTIKNKIEGFGFTLSDDVFYRMTFLELCKVYKEAKRAYEIATKLQQFAESKKSKGDAKR
jgi:hypothetical protein